MRATVHTPQPSMRLKFPKKNNKKMKKTKKNIYSTEYICIYMVTYVIYIYRQVYKHINTTKSFTTSTHLIHSTFATLSLSPTTPNLFPLPFLYAFLPLPSFRPYLPSFLFSFLSVKQLSSIFQIGLFSQIEFISYLVLSLLLLLLLLLLLPVLE